MEFTTQLELHSQTTRLLESVSQSTLDTHHERGSHPSLTLYSNRLIRGQAQKTLL
ncbi:hypothetical protein BT69DRAFT_431433 [Atractiella rhizophila]|nr:hypothetical protein BT69DRAFT_431433 [Atractiella rhizophila]